MLRLFASRIGDFQKLLAKPKSVPSSIATTFGHIEPLGFERFRICELYAELLHCSNMVLLNDPRGEEIVRERDVERERLGREGRSKPVSVDIWGDHDLGNGRQWQKSESYSSDGSDDEESKEDSTNPQSNGQPEHQNSSEMPLENNVSVMSNLEGDNPPILNVNVQTPRELEHVEKKDEKSHGPQGEGLDNANHSETPSDPDVNPATTENSSPIVEEKSVDDTVVPSLSPSLKGRPVVGDYLKMQFVEAKVLPSVVDLFFAHPWNNFLHNVVYDILTQVLNGPMDKGYNRQLAVDLFTTGQLTEKILQGQNASDKAQ